MKSPADAPSSGPGSMPATESTLRSHSIAADLRLVWRFRRYFVPFTLPAIGLMLLAFLQADFAATAAQAANALITQVAQEQTAPGGTDQAAPGGGELSAPGGDASASTAAPAPGTAGAVASAGDGGTPTAAAETRRVSPAGSIFTRLAAGGLVQRIAVAMAIFLVVALIIGLISEQLRGLVNQKFRERVQTDVVRAMSRELAATRGQRDSANSMQIFASDAGALSQLLIFGLVAAAQNALMIVIFAHQLLQKESTGIVLFGLFPAIVIFQVVVAWLFRKREMEAVMRTEQLGSQMRARGAEVFDVLGRLVYFQGERSQTDRLLRLSTATAEAGRRHQLVNTIGGEISQMGTTLALPLVVMVLTLPVTALGVGVMGGGLGPDAAGTIVGAQILLGMLTAATGSLISTPSMLLDSSPSLQRVAAVLDIPDIGPEPVELAQLKGRAAPATIRVQDVSFSFPGAPAPLLQDITLEIPGGACVGVVGPSGCGKSTLARLLLGDQRPSRGRIVFDDVDVTGWHLWWRREVVGYLPAEQGFLRGTLEENVLFGRSRDGVRNYEEALEISGVAAIAREKEREGGMQFLITSKVDDVLSTGQRRKIGIARLLLGQQRIWIFDEPGSGLDPRSMGEVAEGLAAVTKGRTSLIITHDPDVFRTDFNVFLQDGRIAGVGPHEELLRTNPAYAGLVTRHAREREMEQQLKTDLEATQRHLAAVREQLAAMSTPPAEPPPPRSRGQGKVRVEMPESVPAE